MNILIVEDEVKAARSLAAIIADIKPSAVIVGMLQSIESVIDYISNNPTPDLIFMDVQLSDGICFDIFKAVKITSPVVFCTAFDEYALEAFKVNGIDYIVKPFSKDHIANAFTKVGELKNFFQQSILPDINELMAKLGSSEGKKSFLVFKNQKYTTVPTSSIAFFYVRYESTILVGFDKEEFSLPQSLDHIHTLLPPNQFFRLNRQYLINFAAVKETERYFARKLLVKLVIPTRETLLVNKEKLQDFLGWLENR